MESLPIRLSTFEGAHQALLARWLLEPHVAPWFPNRDEYLAFARQPPPNGVQRVVTEDDAALGYLRWVMLSRELLDTAGFPELPAGTADADLLLGDASRCGKGLGVRVLDALSGQLAEQGVPLLVLTTSAKNLRAHSAFRKAGFEIYCEYAPEPFGPCYLMVRSL